MDTPFHEHVRDSLSSIVVTLDNIVTGAVTAAESAAAELNLPNTAVYQSTRVHLARAVIRNQLENSHLDGWEVDVSQQKNTPVHLYSDDFALRFLHTASFVPAPGKNKARQLWYSNSRLLENEQLFSSPEQLLLLWSADFMTGNVSMRVVHTVGTWNYGENAKIDLSIPLDDLQFFEDGAFDTHDDEEDLSMPSDKESAEEAGEGVSDVSS